MLVVRGAIWGHRGLPVSEKALVGFARRSGSVLGAITAGSIVIRFPRVLLSDGVVLSVGGCPGVVSPLLDDRWLPSAGDGAVACDRCPFCGG